MPKLKKMQNQVILSIGSNQGDKLAYIERCFQLIHLEIGNDVHVSKLYLSASWGFESADFYNCALLVHTSETAPQVLAGLQEIEEKMGRAKKAGEGYEARVIDIDIIGFNDEIVTLPDLQIPHPQLHNRLFVLLPLKDLLPNYMHPLLNKKIADLIHECEDEGNCIVISDLELPKKD